MKRLTGIVFAALLLVCGAWSLAFLTGCDTASPTDPITIDPSTATLAAGQQQTFTASGGYDYTWSVDTDNGGELNTRTGNRVVFTCTSSSGYPKTLTVTSTIKGESAGATSTNGTGATYTETATAHIFLEGSTNNVITTPTNATTALEVAASDTKLSTNGTATLTATGGTPTYSWTKNNGLIGTLSDTKGAAIIYTAIGGTGTNVVTCTDSVGASKSVTITQN